MNLLIHDLACAIERDASDTPNDESDRVAQGRTAWIAEWRLRLEHEPVEPWRRLRPARE
jgi:hypothetical protein